MKETTKQIVYCTIICLTVIVCVAMGCYASIRTEQINNSPTSPAVR